MSQCPSDILYSQTHEWVRKDDDQTATVGITDHAQNLLGDLVFIELPESNTNVDAGHEVVVLESVKTAADVYSPLSGKIIAVNEVLQDTPNLVNQDPYGEGWLFRIRVDDMNQLTNLLTARAYQEFIATEEET